MSERTEPTDSSPDDGGPVKQTLLERLFAPRTGPAAAAPGTGDGGTTTPAPGTKWQIDRIDARERRFGYAAAAGALVFAVMIYAVETSNKHFHPVKNQFSPMTALVVGSAAAILLAVGTRIGRRAVLGFIALFTGFSFMNSGGLFLALPFLLLAGMLLWRSHKTQRAAATSARASRSEGAAAARQRPVRPARGGRAAKATPAGPEANKRYTPKKPTKAPPPPPKPSWIERRAASEAERTKG